MEETFHYDSKGSVTLKKNKRNAVSCNKNTPALSLNAGATDHLTHNMFHARDCFSDCYSPHAGDVITTYFLLVVAKRIGAFIFNEAITIAEVDTIENPLQ